MKEIIAAIAGGFEWFDDLVWGPPLLILLLGVGIFLTVSLRGLQVSRLPLAARMVFTPHKESASKKGDLTSFAALCTALAATIGTGNIVGVATAVSIGGPGALFWMFVAAFFGMATKYAECLLAVHFRETDSRGRYVGGPMFYIRNGIGKKYPRLAAVLAFMFALFGIMAGCLGIGTYTQINSIVEAGAQLGVDRLYSAIAVTLIVGWIIYGGLKYIANTSRTVVPVMAMVYIVCCLVVVGLNISAVPDAIMLIVKSAFTTTSAVGGFAGATVLMAMQKGVARGIFSNEAGLGSAPIAAASAKTNSPVEQGLISMTGTFLDTMIICMLTGLTLVLTGAWSSEETGVAMTTLAFSQALGSTAGLYIINISLLFFAMTTIIGWNFYASRCVIYLFGARAVTPFKIIFIMFVASYILIVLFVDMGDATQKMAINTVWTLSDIANGLMAFPNLIALFMLRKVIWSDTRDYFNNLKMKRQKAAIEEK